MKKIRGDKSIRLSYIYTWKYHKETLCVVTFISNKKNVIFFFFFSTKSESRRAKPVLPRGGSGTSRIAGEVVGIGRRRMNKMQKMCTHVCKCENDDTIPGMLGG
jgi:hypothetical protein